MIRDEKTHQVHTAMQTNMEAGMQTLNQSLEQLVRQQKICAETALHYSEEKREFQAEMEQATRPTA